MAYVCIWVTTHNWSHTVRRATITYSFMLGGALGADLIGIAKVLSLRAMIGYSMPSRNPTYCVIL